MADLSFLRANTKPVAILGLGVSGLAVAKACVAAGVVFHAWDDTHERCEQYAGQFPIVDFTDRLVDYDFLVPAAGIKPSHPVLQNAVRMATPIFSDVDLLLLSAPDARVIGVTGTNGKSTTTALIGHILREAGQAVAVGGNIGVPACDLPTLHGNGIYVLEMSSYMLEISANPVADIAVLLNITPDHLDWHGTMANYVAAKEKIFRQRPGHAPQVRVHGINYNNLPSALPSAGWDPLADNLAMQSSVPWTPADAGEVGERIEHPYLKGAHNAQNIQAAIDACRAIGLDDAVIRQHLDSFEGLAYRQKKIRQIDGVSFINDSKATNADATDKALASYDNIYWIVGGQPKSDGLNGLDMYYPKVRKAYLIGAAAEAFADTLNGKVITQHCGTMRRAVMAAHQDARQGTRPAVVLLSPACASFDQYKNFEQRGDDFTNLVNALGTGEVSC